MKGDPLPAGINYDSSSRAPVPQPFALFALDNFWRARQTLGSHQAGSTPYIYRARVYACVRRARVARLCDQDHLGTDPVVARPTCGPIMFELP
jgi:hypothetical protein